MGLRMGRKARCFCAEKEEEEKHTLPTIPGDEFTGQLRMGQDPTLHFVVL